MKLRKGLIKSIIKLLYYSILLGGVIFSFAKISYAETMGGVDSSDHIVINEVYPNPNPESCDLDWCKNEWIELTNLSDEDIVLTGYTIEDLNIFDKINDPDNYKPEILNSFTIPAHGFLLLEKESLSFTLNNDSERIILRKNSIIIDQLNYGTIEGEKQEISGLAKGQSYAFFGTDGWKLTASPTYGEENIFTDSKVGDQEGSIDPVDIVSARGESNGTFVTIIGIVTVLPDVLSLQYFYIQDATGGMQIYSYYKNFPELQIGDTIQVSGELSEVSGERRLKMGAETVIDVLSHSDPPLPKPVEIAKIEEDLEGQYVKISGTVAETSGDTFIVQDSENHQVKVVIKGMTNIEKPKMRKGDQVEISGIVSQYKDEYRILPIKQEDVKIINQNINTGELPETGYALFFYPLFSLIILLLWNIFQKVKMKLSESRRIYFFRLLLATFMH